MAFVSKVTRVRGPGLGVIEKAVRDLTKKRLLVGIPGDTAARQPLPGQKGTPISNAVIGYIQERGDDELHIPARPFLVPGVTAALPAITKGLRKAVVSALSGKSGDVNNGFDEAGLAAQVSVKATMRSGSFAPLSDRTIEARARRRNPETGKLLQDGRSRDARSFLKLRGEGTPDDVLHDAGFATPLIDTGSLILAIQYAIKDKP